MNERTKQQRKEWTNEWKKQKEKKRKNEIPTSAYLCEILSDPTAEPGFNSRGKEVFVVPFFHT